MSKTRGHFICLILKIGKVCQGNNSVSFSGEPIELNAGGKVDGYIIIPG